MIPKIELVGHLHLFSQCTISKLDDLNFVPWKEAFKQVIVVPTI